MTVIEELLETFKVQQQTIDTLTVTKKHHRFRSASRIVLTPHQQR